jgi:hypothetical protein
MLSQSDFIREFPVVLKTDRDCETPLVVEFIKARAPIGSLLDIGAHYSGHHYAPAIRGLVRQYDGIDIQPADNATASILDSFYTGNANTFPWAADYEAVICVSTIEHAGVSTYKGDYVAERMKLFERCLYLASKYVWISFPFGQEYVCPDQMAIITDAHLAYWEVMTEKFKVKERFFYSQGPQAGHPWREHSKRDVACRIPYLDFEGNKSICVMEIEK